MSENGVRSSRLTWSLAGEALGQHRDLSGGVPEAVRHALPHDQPGAGQREGADQQGLARRSLDINRSIEDTRSYHYYHYYSIISYSIISPL